MIRVLPTTFALLLALSGGAFAAEPSATMVPLSKGAKISNPEVVEFGASPVIVHEPYEFKVKGVLKMIGLRYFIKQARWKTLETISYNGRRYVLLPVQEMTQGRPLSQGSASLSASCGATLTPHVAFDFETRAALEKGVALETS